MRFSLSVKMSVKKDKICRLCLQIPRNDFEEIDEVTKKIFDILLLKLDLGMIKDPIICQDCLEVAKKCLNFKSTCINTEKIILSHSTVREKATHNIKIIFKEREHVEKTVDEDLNICRICMTRLERNNFVYLDTLMNEHMFEMLSECMPEMDFNIIEDPIMCATCRQNLGVYAKFVLNCLDIEEKVEAYCGEEGADSMGEVNLGDILHFLQDNLEYPVKSPQKCVIRVKPNRLEDKHLEGYCGLMKIEEELDIKEEEINLMERPSASLSEMRLDKCDDTFHLKEYCIETKSEVRMYSCSLCAYESKHKHNLETHLMVHKDPSEVEMNKCSLCTFESKHKGSLKTHMLVHKNPSEIKMYKCSLCAYESKRKIHISHMMTHKDPSEIKTYKCSLCAFESNYKRCLKRHMLVHKDCSEIKMNKCLLCGYETRHEDYLKRHMLVHKDTSQIKMNKCSFCAFESKHKGSLNTHMLVHKDCSEIKMNKCSLCRYETRHKGHLKRHMLLVHKDTSETKIYKCSLCTYKSKQKHYIKNHMVLHKDPSKIKWSKCSFCAFESKHKSSLKSHMLVHKDPSKIKWHKCSLCAFESKHQRSLKRHMLIHNDPS